MQLKSQTLPNCRLISLQTRRCHAVLHHASRRQQGDALNSHTFKRVFTILFRSLWLLHPEQQRSTQRSGCSRCPSLPPIHLCSRSHSLTSRDSLVHPLIPPQVLQPLGGKGGGKPTKAQGSAGDTSKLGDVLDLATKFAQSKLQ